MQQDTQDVIDGLNHMILTLPMVEAQRKTISDAINKIIRQNVQIAEYEYRSSIQMSGRNLTATEAGIAARGSLR